MRHLNAGVVGLVVLFLFAWQGILQAGSAPSVLQVSNRHFYFRFHEPDRPDVDRIIAQSERLYEKISRDIGVVSSEPIGVIFAYSEDEFNQFQPAGVGLPHWAGGVAYPGLNRMVIRSPRLIEGSPDTSLRTFTHELSHLILARPFGRSPIPPWLNEGFAMYEAYEWSPSQDLLMTRAVLSGSLISLNRLTQAFNGNDFAVEQAYVQSYSLVNDLISTYGREDFHAFVLRLARGQPFEPAFEESFHLSVQGFEADWRRRLTFRYSWIPILTSTALLWFLIASTLIGAYVIRKRRNRRTLQAWREEEQWAERGNETSDEEEPRP
jgi:hypothetical protein